MRGEIKKLSAEFCEKNGLVVLQENKESVVIGYVEKPDSELERRIERYFLPQKIVEYQRIQKDEFDVLLARLYSGNSYNTGKKSQSEDEHAIRTNLDETSAAKAAPAVNLLNSILSEGIMKKASDIHIDVNSEATKIKYRKDGKLFLMLEAENEKAFAVISRIKLLSNLNILEHRRCQDGRFEYSYAGFTYDIRVSVINGIEGESVVLRILGGNIKAPELEELGFTRSQLETIKKMMSLDSGLILVAGPTGSGKTTTLAGIITRLVREDINIITVEDPVEYRIKGVLQVNVEEEIGKTFFEVLKRMLRHDPDILMVGEIRDEQTAEMACRMALTGHLVFASVHTSSCEETPIRLTDMGVPLYIVAAVLKGVISQRLVEKKGGGRTVKAELRLFDNSDEVRVLCKR